MLQNSQVKYFIYGLSLKSASADKREGCFAVKSALYLNRVIFFAAFRNILIILVENHFPFLFSHPIFTWYY